MPKELKDVCKDLEPQKPTQYPSEDLRPENLKPSIRAESNSGGESSEGSSGAGTSGTNSATLSASSGSLSGASAYSDTTFDDSPADLITPKSVPCVNNESTINPKFPIDSLESTCLYFWNLDWWTNEEVVRGWAVDCGCEEAVENVIFDEHKPNGKSKGVVYVQFSNIAAARAVKQHVEQLSPRTQSPGSHSEEVAYIVSFGQPTDEPFQQSHSSRNRENINNNPSIRSRNVNLVKAGNKKHTFERRSRKGARPSFRDNQPYRYSNDGQDRHGYGYNNYYAGRNEFGSSHKRTRPN